MQYWRCKCGKWEWWTSGERPFPCDECPTCHTTAAQGPEGHGRAVPHEFIATKVETDEGDKTLSRCRWCMKTRAQVKAAVGRADHGVR